MQPPTFSFPKAGGAPIHFLTAVRFSLMTSKKK